MRTNLFRNNMLPLLGRGLGGGFLLLWGLGGGCTLFAQDLSVCYGKGYTLNSKADAPATGTSPVSYQWYEDGILLTGKNASSLSIPVGKAAGEYKYVRMAANDDCPTGMPSNTFTVRVNALPTVTASAAASACAGATVVFTAAAGGGTTAAMTYTWTIAGATASTTTTTYRRTLSTTGSNTYSVTVRNSHGCVSDASPAKTITINGPAGRDQAPNTCGCAAGLTACNGYCRNLLADGNAVCYNNVEVKQICVTDDYMTGCEGGVPPFGLHIISRQETQNVIALLDSTYGLGHAIWTSELGTNANGLCRYVCDINGCNTCVTGLNQYKYGWLGGR